LLCGCPADDIQYPDGNEPGPTSSSESTTSTSGTTTTSPTREESSVSGDAVDPDGGHACINDPPDLDYVCECPPDRPVDIDTPLCRGFTAAEVVAALQDVAIPFDWKGYVAARRTTLRLDAAYVGGSILEGAGGDAHCSFINWPCPEGVTMDLELTLWTDDGWLQLTLPAQFSGVPAWDTAMTTSWVAVADNAGTLATQPLELEGTPVVLEQVAFSSNSFANLGGAVYVHGLTTDGDALTLGASPR
jgi:hypothetical protein